MQPIVECRGFPHEADYLPVLAVEGAAVLPRVSGAML